MIRKLIILSCILIGVTASGCRIPEIATTPGEAGEIYTSVRLKVKLTTESGTENTRVILGYNDTGDRLIFLGPMNQVMFEIIVQGNYATVIIAKKKKFWRGEFSEFLDRLWQIDLTYNEIKALLLERRISARKLEENGLKLRIFDSEDRSDPIDIHLTGEQIRLEFRVDPPSRRSGKIDFRRELTGYSRVTLENLLRKDPD